ncbi:hypothetical protein PTKIN_Ptkin01aG0045100 [Pterospermum kingtungense]
MGRCSRSRVVAIVCAVLVVSCMVVPTLQATVFTVGEHIGWIPGVDYNAWAKSKQFKVGDYLVFDYPSGHSVDEVFENDYNTCTTGHPISSDNTGSTLIALLSVGPRYFICGVAGHCALGMKLAVNVAAQSQSTPSLSADTNTTASTFSSTPASN